MSKDKIEQYDLLQAVNKELFRVVGANPYTYTLDEVLKEIAPKVGVDIPILRNDMLVAIKAGKFVLDNKGCVAFPS